MIRLEVPAEFRFRSVVVRTVAAACRLARGAGLPEDDELDLSNDFDAKFVSAISEAFNNVVLHAYGTVPGQVDFEIDVEPGTVVVRMADHGDSLDPTAATPPDLDTLPEGGMGLFIIEACVDSFEYTPGRPGEPNVWSLEKRVPRH